MAVFVDTGAWFAYFVRRDPDHAAAAAWIKNNRQPLVTTDYVLDELLTLLENTPRHRKVVMPDSFQSGDVLLPQQITGGHGNAVTFTEFQQYRDKEWSFTDCTSKVVIDRLAISEAFAFDHHFEQFGTVARVP